MPEPHISAPRSVVPPSRRVVHLPRPAGARRMRLDGQPAGATDERAEGHRQSVVILEGVIEGTTDAIFVKDRDGHYLMINTAGAALLGRTVPEVIGRHDREFFTPDTVQQVLDSDERALRSDRPLTCEECITAAGVNRTYLATKGPFRNGRGEVIGTIGISRDITERKQVEAALRQSEAQFRAQNELLQTLFDHIPALIVAFGPDDRPRLINRHWQNLVGYTLEEAQQPDFAEKLYPDPEVRSAVSGFIERSTGEWCEFTLRVKDGREREIAWSNVRLSDGGSVGIGMDVSHRNELENQLRQSQKMDAIGRLAGGVAHDFNNMLAVINGYSELLLSGGSVGPRAEGPLQEIRKAGERAAGLTRQLLALSRKQILESRFLDVNALVADLDRMLRRLIGEDIELVTLFDPELGQVKADPGQLEQVLLNLCVNARDAMPRGGRLVIETRSTVLDEDYSAHHPDVPPGRYVSVSIADTGCGMSKAVLARVFEPFFTTKPPGEGTGLGLATVFGVVKQSGGHVAVESQVGAGTTFCVLLPEASGEPEATELSQTGGLPAGHGTILLCEDESMVRDLVESILTGCGYRVLSALEPAEALRIAQEHPAPIDLLLTDVVMPRMSGRQLAERLRVIHPETPVLFMSGYTDDAVLRHGVEGAEVAFLPKPFTPLALITQVAEQVASARRQPLGRRGSVFIVDDDRELRASLAELLMDEGYRVEQASSGERALEILRGGYRPDVILLDLMMPGMNGWVFRIEQQKDARLASIPTLIVSAAYDSAAVSSYLRADGSLNKPLNIPALLQSIAGYCT